MKVRRKSGYRRHFGGKVPSHKEKKERKNMKKVSAFVEYVIIIHHIRTLVNSINTNFKNFLLPFENQGPCCRWWDAYQKRHFFIFLAAKPII
ncbi:MAG: hypothetical protein ACI4IW_02030 [Oscillospiraceae bacterium]